MTSSTGQADRGTTGVPALAGEAPTTTPTRRPGTPACRSGYPLANVYHPDRLRVIDGCRTVSGTVESIRSEADGDTHFDLAVDPAYTGLLRPANGAYQHGWLVAEIVPADEPGCAPGQAPRRAFGSYDYGACTGADEVAPVIGSHVDVTGPYVLDDDHGGWAEIHPVWAISTSGPAAPSAAGPTSTAGTARAPRILSLTSPVRRGSEAALRAQATPNTGCDLAVTLPSGAQSASQGLGPATADPSGRVGWTWRTGTGTTPGGATATVTCGSARASRQFEITT